MTSLANGKPRGRGAQLPEGLWDELHGPGGSPREAYGPLLERFAGMGGAELRRLEDWTEATLREMGVTFDVRPDRTWGPRPWSCDILPQLFGEEEWGLIEEGFKQRLRAFELFLQDIHGPRRILREGVLPIAPVLGSPYFEGPATGIRPTDGAYLHLSGICLTRLPDGRLAVKNHYFGHASGIAYMMQNRRALARVNPDMLDEVSPRPIAETPTAILEELRAVMPEGEGEPTIVLLSGGPSSAAYPEHTLLARRMGVPVVQGGDLLVLEEKVYLKTVTGLERVEMIYTRVADPWLDPMVFRSDSLLGVPGLTHCIRKGSVGIVNGIGSQLADDRALLPHAWQIIRYYLGETPILPTLETAWLGDPDMREIVFDRMEDYRIRPLCGERVLGARGAERRAALREIAEGPHRFVAQPVTESAETLCYHQGRPVRRLQDHIVFALRRGGDFEVFPGALTRVSSGKGLATASELGGGSKDTWVLAASRGEGHAAPRAREHPLPSHSTTSRVAESFYWLGRYLERSYGLAYMVGVVSALESEEMNPAERAVYFPVWGKILPPLEGGARKRNIATKLDRYRLVLDPAEPGSLALTLRRTLFNAESLQDAISPEAWAVLGDLRERFGRARFRPGLPPEACARETRRFTEAVLRLVPQFFGVAEASMLADDGWRFCLTGRHLERAIVTANALVSIAGQLARRGDRGAGDPGGEQAAEIELSAFLRLLGSRDAYRRIYQMRASPSEVLEMLCRHPDAPRSIRRCLARCAEALGATARRTGAARPAAMRSIEALAAKLERTRWDVFFRGGEEEEGALLPAPGAGAALGETLDRILAEVLALHDIIGDGFLSHQEIIGRTAQAPLQGEIDGF